MVRGFAAAGFALLSLGCVSTAAERVGGCGSVGISERGLVAGQDDAYGASSWFDARLVSAQAKDARDACLIEGVAPTHQLAQAQLDWIQAVAGCGVTTHAQALEAVDGSAFAGYRFAVQLQRDPAASACAPATGGSGGVVEPPGRAYPAHPPRYPPGAARRGAQGTSMLLVRVGAEGNATAVIVSRSSGHPDLDLAAVDAARQWRFTPARGGDGRAVPHTVRVPVRFEL